MAKYTQGEWEAREHIDGSHWFVDAGTHPDERVTIVDGLSDGDARLIAAAPQMYAALGHIRRAWGHGCTGMIPKVLIDEIQAVLAAIDGEVKP